MYDDDEEELETAQEPQQSGGGITAEDIQGGLDGAATIGNALRDKSDKAGGIADLSKKLGGKDLMSSGEEAAGAAKAAKGAAEAAKEAGAAAGAAKGAAEAAKGAKGGGKGAAIAAGASAATGIMDKGVDKMLGDKGPEVKEGDKVGGTTVDENGNEIENPNAPKKGEKVAPGMEVDENGNAKQSATSRVQNVAAQGAAAYFTSGNAQAMEAAKKVSDSKTGRRLSDVVDKAPGAHQASELVDKLGVLDTAEGALGAYTNFRNGNYAEALKEAKKANKGVMKTTRIILIVTFVLLLPVILLVTTVAVAANSFSNESSTSSEEIYENMNNYEWDSSSGGGTERDNGNGNIEGATSLLDVPYYKQGDYKSTAFGGGTISSSGCSVTSLAMAIQYLTGDTTTPPDVVNMIADRTGYYNHFYVAPAGQSWAIMTTVPTYYGLTGEQIGIESIPDALADDKVVIASMSCCTFTSGGHFIVIKGYDNDKKVFYVNDPADQNKNTTAWATSIFVNEAKGYWAISK